MNIPDHNSESLETMFELQKLKFFYVDPNPGSGSGIRNLFDPGFGIRAEKIRIRGIRDKHLGSATLIFNLGAVWVQKTSITG